MTEQHLVADKGKCRVAVPAARVVFERLSVFPCSSIVARHGNVKRRPLTTVLRGDLVVIVPQQEQGNLAALQPQQRNRHHVKVAFAGNEHHVFF